MKHPSKQPTYRFNTYPDRAFTPHKCLACGRAFWAKRAHAKTCSTACRVKLCRLTRG